MPAPNPRTLVVALAIAVLGLLAIAGVPQGAAESGTFEFSETFSEPVDFTATCLGAGASGTLTHLETKAGHITENGPPGVRLPRPRNLHRQRPGRVRRCPGPWWAPSSPTPMTTPPATNSSPAPRPSAARGRYGGDGQPLGPVSIHAVSHISYRDANTNHQTRPASLDL